MLLYISACGRGIAHKELPSIGYFSTVKFSSVNFSCLIFLAGFDRTFLFNVDTFSCV